MTARLSAIRYSTQAKQEFNLKPENLEQSGLERGYEATRRFPTSREGWVYQD